MTRLIIRKSGGANIVSIPKAVLKTLGLQTNSAVELSLEHNRIVLTPVKEQLTLKTLLAGSPKKRLSPTVADKAWLNEPAAGKEEL